MTVDLSTPIEHGAKHDVEVVIEGLPVENTFCSRMFVALKLTDEQVKYLYEELGEWIRTKR